MYLFRDIQGRVIHETWNETWDLSIYVALLIETSNVFNESYNIL